MVAAGAAFFFAGSVLTEFFTGGTNTSTSMQAAILLRVASFAMPSLAIAMIISGALRGAGDTRWPMAINMLGMLGIRIPGAYLMLGPLSGWAVSLGPSPEDGLLFATWLVMVTDLTTRAALVAIRFLQGDWKHTRV